MKQTIMISAALICACTLAAGIASAEEKVPQPQVMHDEQFRDAGKAVPVAGFSPNFADQQNITGPATPDSGENGPTSLTKDANRLVRWQGWLDVDAFSASVLEQMQTQLGSGIELGKFTIAEPSIAEAVSTAEKEFRSFEMIKNLDIGAEGQAFDVKLGEPKFYVWIYRHNYTDTGLYQLYVSVKGNMLIGSRTGGGGTGGEVKPHKDIQSLGYEFGKNATDTFIVPPNKTPVVCPVEIWRGAVVRVNAQGKVEVVGNEAGVITIDNQAVEKAPVADWEKAPRLVDNAGANFNPHYKPGVATGAGYVAPPDREIKIDQKAGDVQKEKRVNTVTPFRYRNR